MDCANGRRVSCPSSFVLAIQRTNDPPVEWTEAVAAVTRGADTVIEFGARGESAMERVFRNRFIKYHIH